jgi:hypothetical protein
MDVSKDSGMKAPMCMTQKVLVTTVHKDDWLIDTRHGYLWQESNFGRAARDQPF